MNNKQTKDLKDASIEEIKAAILDSIDKVNSEQQYQNQLRTEIGIRNIQKLTPENKTISVPEVENKDK